ncbi:MAG: DUF5618 family protein [Nitrospirae bacterium]|nr:DUF5618 family protein [Nitrospirota bacterium]
MKEALRYLNNAKEILKSAAMEGKFYADKKPVREAFGTAYLAILEAINEKLISKGLTEKELPKSVEEYKKALKKHIGVHNGKLLKEFNNLYESLHIYGYYRGGIDRVILL